MAPQMPGPVVKVHKRLLPLFVSLVVVCYLDRTSLAFAALQLCQQHWFDARVYGLGSGVFYAGYVLFQVPSNLILSRVGARNWLPLITAAWGLVATCCIFIKGPASFYALRLALGVAESGAFPAMWHVCGQFYPRSHITVAYSVIEASIAISQIIAAPVAAALLQLSGVGGLAGWQHLFLAEGLATLVLAGILRWRLPGSVLTADFLTAEDKLWLLQQLQPTTAAPVDAAVVVDAAATATADGSKPNASPKGEQQQDEADDLQHGQQQRCLGAVGGLSSGCSGAQDHQQQQQQELQQCQHGDQQQLLPSDQLLVQQRQPVGFGCHRPAVLPAGQQLLLTIRNRLIWYLMLLKALKDIALDGLVYWVPMLVHALIDSSSTLGLHTSSSSSSSNSTEGGDTPGANKHCGGKDSQLRAVLLTAIPFGTAAVAALTLGHSSEVTQERRKHIGLPLLLGGAVFALLPWLLQLQSHVPSFLAVTAAVVAADATTGPFWTWVHLAASPGTEAVSLAAVNSVGKAGGFLGPVSFGLILHATGSYVPSILLVAAVLMAGGLLALFYRVDQQQLHYSKLQEDGTPAAGAIGSGGSSSRQAGGEAGGDHSRPAQQHLHWHQPHREQHKQQRAQQRQQQPELELLRGSTGDRCSS